LSTITLPAHARSRPVEQPAKAPIHTRVPWPLLPVLAAQAFLSARLLHLNTAFVDEATYLYAGHQEWNHWIHGWPVPAYSTYFSGAPVIYPPLGAIADSFGGLAGARVLSLAFMLLATTMLWATARRLHGPRAAFAAIAVFVSLGSTQALGAFATYDAMALCVMTVAAYCIVRSAEGRDSTRWWVAAAALIALANATKYATALWDPFLIALLAVLLWRRGDVKRTARRCAAVIAVVCAILAAGLAVGGGFYYSGISSTTLARAAGTTTPGRIAGEAWRYVGWALVAAALAPLLAWFARRSRRDTAVMLVLLAAGLAAPLNQIRIHTDTSLQKHVDFGIWFACIAAGYAVDALAQVLHGRAARITVAGLATGAALALTAPAGYAQSRQYFHEWPNREPLAVTLQPYVHPGNSQYLAEEYDVAAYYLGGRVDADQWDDTWFFKYTPPGGVTLEGIPAYQAAVRAHYFSLIILDFGDTQPVDDAITAAMTACPDRCGYRVVATAPYQGAGWSQQFTVWQYEGGAA
jgi:4-amino-4-deoxy-L-arabinose transferase-like glycosyltransferase